MKDHCDALDLSEDDVINSRFAEIEQRAKRAVEIVRSL